MARALLLLLQASMLAARSRARRYTAEARARWVLSNTPIDSVEAARKRVMQDFPARFVRGPPQSALAPGAALPSGAGSGEGLVGPCRGRRLSGDE